MTSDHNNGLDDEVMVLNVRVGTILAIEKHLESLGKFLSGEEMERVADRSRTIDVRVADALRYLTLRGR